MALLATLLSCSEIRYLRSKDHTLNFSNLITLISVTILVGVEVLGAAVAFGWAVGGLLQLGHQVTMGISALCLAGGAWATWRFFQMARHVETL